eukprot:11718969-Prorocentrum_lima.AAC.1
MSRTLHLGSAQKIQFLNALQDKEHPMESQTHLTVRPHEHISDLTIVSDASPAPGGGRSHEGVT